MSKLDTDGRMEQLLSLLRSVQVAKGRQQLLRNLSEYGVEWNEQEAKLQVPDLRNTQKRLSLATNQSGLKYQGKVSDYLANWEDVDIGKIDPELFEVRENHISNQIWAYCLSLWSVPVSAGYGRRMRFLVIDKQNDKVIGLFGLCDPLIGFNLRDEIVGWDREQKHERLYNWLTAYVLGAVPPYNHMLGGKLVALTTLFPEVRALFHQKYSGKTTIIAGKQKAPVLAMIDTFGAFGKSSIYTNLLNWKFINYTKGQSHIHITANGSWELIKEFVSEDSFGKYKFGQGSNWKLRTLRIGLRNLGFPNEDILSIGWKRGYYLNPLLNNWREYLTLQDSTPEYINYSKEFLLNYWRQRWILPRIDRIRERFLDSAD